LQLLLCNFSLTFCRLISRNRFKLFKNEKRQKCFYEIILRGTEFETKNIFFFYLQRCLFYGKENFDVFVQIEGPCLPEAGSKKSPGRSPNKQLQGCQIFLDAMYQNGDNITHDNNIYMYQKRKWPQSIPNGHKRYRNFPFQCRPKCTKSGRWFENEQFGIDLGYRKTMD
jgi:hypothetical protein